jgi:choline monooxygenase
MSDRSRLERELARFDDTLPLERARTIPSSWYFEPDLFELERSTVFGATWQAVGRTAQVAEPSQFFTADVAGEPILVLRDETGTLRAFHNVCRHRAARVMELAEGRCTKLRCRYHGWTYDLAGNLRGTPEFDGVQEFPREANGLPPVAVDCWGPAVFVHLGSNPPALAEYLAPMAEQTVHCKLNDLEFFARREYELECNWKVFVDNYLDGGYHVNTVHPGLAGVLDYSEYRTDVFGHASVQTSPMKPAETDGDNSAAMVRQGDFAYYWWVFPNFMVNIYSGVMDTNLVLPISPTRCRVIMDFYFATTGQPASESYRLQSVAVADRIQQEDIDICAEVQRGLCSRSFDTGRFSVRREIAGYHFHQLLARTLRGGV